MRAFVLLLLMVWFALLWLASLVVPFELKGNQQNFAEVLHIFTSFPVDSRRVLRMWVFVLLHHASCFLSFLFRQQLQQLQQPARSDVLFTVIYIIIFVLLKNIKQPYLNN